ncbi:shikimate dehydrogenase [Marinivivus vitaminiproducens]|uniref:shikimate dehydrogenase n=1 Tax=Marinivivus vitaminiproducens TaxID=3035935 RepID=UPI0027A91C90|nr:shikimate dehydrogenase [Geminicoccaceae bacterium SCSIO 64248]
MTDLPLAGVIGWPIHHSRSPRLHGFWLRRHGIAGAYLPMAVAPDRLEAALRGLAALGFRGVNVTVPHKETALALADSADGVARRIGAANLLTVDAEGRLHATNTDAFGFAANLKAACPSFRAEDGPAVVLGAGGAARAVLASLLDDGSPEIRLANRSPERALALAEAFDAGRVRPVAWDEREAAMDGAALLVNTTSLGMQGQPPLAMRLDALPLQAVVADIVYVPLETGLLAAARARGHVTVDGLGMLLWQAQPAFRTFFGIAPEVDQALRDAVLGEG